MLETFELPELLHTAETAAIQAGKLALEHWSRPRSVSRKGFRDLVTETDLAAQAIVTGIIRTRFPGHGFLTEEADPSLPVGREMTWIIDPVDGTSNYSRGIPVYCVSVAVAETPADGASRVLAGAVYDPARDELFSAASGMGSKLNGVAIRVSPTSELAEAIVGVDWSRSRVLRQATLEAVASFAHHVHTLRAVGAAALALSWLAAGRLDLYFNKNLMPWDVAAADLLIQEAGGRSSDLSDVPLDVRRMNGACVASNDRLHQSFLALLG